MKNTFFLKYFFFVATLFLVASCDNSTNELGANIVGGDNFETGDLETYDVNAINQSTGPVESNDLEINPLGIYDNPVFGTTKANFATQLQLGTLNPTIDSALHPKIKSVILTIPYFSTNLSTDTTTGVTTYQLDSIYGSGSKIKLHVYESKYYIRDIDPTSATQEAQKYYTDQNIDFDTAKGQQLNDSLVNQNEDFVFSPLEYTETDELDDNTVTNNKHAPAMRLNLNIDFFKQKIIEAPTGKLLNNNVFNDYFRGLYFSVDKSGSDAGLLAMMNFKAGYITIKYKEDASLTDNTPAHRVHKSLLLNLSGKSVSLLENTPNTVATTNRLVLHGGDGSMAVLDLFGPDADNNGVADKLEELRANKWLVNDASLTFYIDKNAMATSNEEPSRIYLYDLKNKRPLVDYYTDQSSNSLYPNYGKTTFGGIISKTDSRGTEYKIRITNHLRALLKNADSTNVRLGLVVMQNINTAATNKKLKSPIISSNFVSPGLMYVPIGSVMNPFGTILYGSSIPVGDTDYDKRLKLKIYFTKPKQN